MRPIERSGAPNVATCVLIGVALGWITLPLLVLAAAAARGSTGTDWIAPVIASGIVAAGLGSLIGVMGLGWSGLISAVGGAVGGMALPYVAIPPLLGLHAPPISVYGDYLPGLIPAAVAAVMTMVIGGRSGPRLAVRPVAIAAIGAVGLAVLALWFGFWVVVTPSIGRAT